MITINKYIVIHICIVIAMVAALILWLSNLSPAPPSPLPPPNPSHVDRGEDASSVEPPQKMCISAYLADLCGDSNQGIDGQCALSSLQSSFYQPQSTHPKRSDGPVQSALKMIDMIYGADVSAQEEKESQRASQAITHRDMNI